VRSVSFAPPGRKRSLTHVRDDRLARVAPETARVPLVAAMPRCVLCGESYVAEKEAFTTENTEVSKAVALAAALQTLARFAGRLAACALAHIRDQLSDVEGLWDDAKNGCRRRRRCGALQVRRHHDHARRGGAFLFEKAQNAVAVHARHHQVEQDRSVVGPSQFLDRLEPVACAFDDEVLALEDTLDHRTDGVVIVYDQNLPLGFLGHCASGAREKQTDCQSGEMRPRRARGIVAIR
jgi:hypothetical protein